MTSTAILSEGREILVVAPDGDAIAARIATLVDDGVAIVRVADLAALADRIGADTGVIVLAEEAIDAGQDRVAAMLAAQPGWSDIPIALIAAGRGGDDAEVKRVPAWISNYVVLEPPVGRSELASCVAAALRLRRKQFEMRDRLADIADNEERLRLATSAADVGTWDLDAATGSLRWDARCKALFGLPPDAGVTLDGTFYAGLHPDDLATTADAIARAMDPGGDGNYEIEYRTIGLGDGIERWCSARGSALFADGRPTRFIGTIVDITPRKRAELALAASEQALKRESRELDHLNRTLEQKVAERTAALEEEMASRLRAEAALRQSQKMEAVGQLTGGIAHDFNNMLTGVIGAMDIMKRRIATGRIDDLDRFMDAATTSAQRAAALTQRLLAFSRRQSLDLKAIDVDALIESLDDLLRGSIRENIALAVMPAAAGLPRASADANQLENALLNLVINARDAMPDGGALTIETSTVTLDDAYTAARPDVAPGAYVVIAVSDTGVGMAPEVMDKVFEPFFTTKPIGQGTGLGLSMVYGFARQSGGQVRIHSRPGQGTSVKLYLPVADDAQATKGADAAPDHTAAGRGEVVLLVEDDVSVRLLVRDVLNELGYQSIEAASADEAMPLIRGERRIDLMVSDVGLPGMSGRELAERARQHRPDLPILFVTGYAENAAIRAGFLGTGMDMITKPFAIETLSAKVAAMMPG